MLREESHPTHANLDEALAIVNRIRPKRTVFVHMGYEVHYQEWQERLPSDCQLAYDGWHSQVHVFSDGPYDSSKESICNA